MVLWSETIVVYDMKLATEDRNDKKFLLTSKFCPTGDCLSLPRSYIHVLNHEKNCIKSDFKEIILKLAKKMDIVIRTFCLHQNCVPWGLSVSAPGLYKCIKS